MWAADEAASQFSHACAQARIGAHVVSTSCPRNTGTALQTYHVVPDVASPYGAPRRRMHELLLRSRSQGTIKARSLARAQEELAGFHEENPGVGRDADAKVIGPGRPVPEPSRAPLPSTREVLALLLAAIAVCTVVALVLMVLLPDGSSPLVAMAFLAAASCFFGVWLLLRRPRAGTVNTWLPVVLTALFPVILVPAAHLNVYAHLSEFGISPGDAEVSGFNLFLSGRESALIIFPSAVAALGLFGFLYHFHFGGWGPRVSWSGSWRLVP